MSVKVESGDQRGSSHALPTMIAEPKRKEKDFLYLPDKSSQLSQWQITIIYFELSVSPLDYFPTIALLAHFASLWKNSLLSLGGLAHGSLCLQTLNCSSLLIPDKPNFPDEIAGSLF